MGIWGRSVGDCSKHLCWPCCLVGTLWAFILGDHLMPSIFAIDPSTSCTGWVFGTPGTKPEVGHLRFAPKGAADEVVCGNALKWLNAMLSERKPDYVAIESPFLGGSTGTSGRTLFVLYSLNMFLRTTVWLKTGQKAVAVAPATARKALTGKGRFDKGQAKWEVFAACKAFGWVTDDDPYDVSDACAIWVGAATKVDPAFASSFTPLGQAMGAV